MTDGAQPSPKTITWGAAAFTAAIVTAAGFFTTFLPASYVSLHLDYGFLYDALRFVGAQFLSTLLVIKGISAATK